MEGPRRMLKVILDRQWAYTKKTGPSRLGVSWRLGRFREDAKGDTRPAVGLLRKLVPRGLGRPGGLEGPRRMLKVMLDRLLA